MAGKDDTHEIARRGAWSIRKAKLHPDYYLHVDGEPVYQACGSLALMQRLLDQKKGDTQ